MKYLISLTLLVVLVTGCQKTNDKNPALFGKWEGVNWLIFDKPSNMDASQVHFEFLENGQYNASFGVQQETGTWRTEKDKLYTTAQGKQEIMVKLLKSDGQALHFEMNRGGQKETLELKKQ